MKKITIINGPNLNLLGKRETDIYGGRTFESYLEELKGRFSGKAALEYVQSNVEGELINLIQKASSEARDIVINPAGYSHTSIAIADALATISTRAIEVHISNIYKREGFRHLSITGSKCSGVISGLGLEGYGLAIEYLLNA